MTSPPPKGPLDELLVGLRDKKQPLPYSPLHPRVVSMGHEDGSRSLVACFWESPESAASLHAQLKPLLEAALLAELSLTGEQMQQVTGPLRSVQLLMYQEGDATFAQALAPFGLKPVAVDDAVGRRAAALMRGEALLLDRPVPDSPLARFEVQCVPTEHPLANEVGSVLRRQTEGAWGAAPGLLARRAADALASADFAGVEPTAAGIERLESLLVHTKTDVIRWIEPVWFQSLCDLIAVAAHTAWGMQVQWGVCEPEQDTGLCPPPVIRVERPGETAGHVPLGQHVLGWCIMPRRPDETIPPLWQWAEHEFSG